MQTQLFQEGSELLAGRLYDFSRTHDPVNPQCYQKFVGMLHEFKEGDTICFWTKNPEKVLSMYRSLLDILRKRGVLILFMISTNFYKGIVKNGYEVGSLIEPGVPAEIHLESLVEYLSEKHIQLRFDPLIPEFMSMSQVEKVLKLAQSIHANKVIVNFIAPKYNSALMRLEDMLGITGFVDDKEKVRVLTKLRDMFAQSSSSETRPIKIAVCAESHTFAESIEGILPARCSDPEWLASLGYTVKGGKHSRTGCGCFYTKSISCTGKCEHGCVYCYSNKC